MGPSRRSLLTGFSALAIAPGCSKGGGGRRGWGDTGAWNDTKDGNWPAPSRPPEPDALWEPTGDVDSTVFPTGVHVGDATFDSVQINVWMDVSEATLEFAKSDGEGWIPVDLRADLVRDGVCSQTSVDGLTADTAYCVVARFGQIRSAVTRFRTALPPDGFRKVTFAAASCLGGNRPWPSLSHVSETRPDAFLLLGDTVYADGATTLVEFRRYWRSALTTQGLRDVTANSSVIATWDDHEVVNNFAGLVVDADRFDAGLMAFREGLPQRVRTDGSLWRKISWGRTVDVFVLDCRGERDGDQQYISEEQLQWLKDELLESPARFKLVLTSVPITDYSPIFGQAVADDRWQGHPAQRSELLDHVVAHEIEGILWITGDFHMSTASRVDPPGGVAENQWEVMVGTGGSFLNIAAELLEPREQFPVIFAQWCSTLIHLDPGTGQVRVEWVGDDGQIIETFEAYP
jgi:alkaline phosphatase D